MYLTEFKLYLKCYKMHVLFAVHKADWTFDNWYILNLSSLKVLFLNFWRYCKKSL